MASGYNETSLDEIRECILCWAKPSKDQMIVLSRLSVNELASHFDLEIQESKVEFPMEEDPVNLIVL